MPLYPVFLVMAVGRPVFDTFMRTETVVAAGSAVVR